MWTGAANVKFQNIEWAENFKVLIDSWNMKTNNWLREAVYKRVTPKGKKPGFKSSLLTYGTSAFWVREECLIIQYIIAHDWYFSTVSLQGIT